MESPSKKEKTKSFETITECSESSSESETESECTINKQRPSVETQASESDNNNTTENVDLKNTENIDNTDKSTEKKKNKGDESFVVANFKMHDGALGDVWDVCICVGLCYFPPQHEEDSIKIYFVCI